MASVGFSRFLNLFGRLYRNETVGPASLPAEVVDLLTSSPPARRRVLLDSCLRGNDAIASDKAVRIFGIRYLSPSPSPSRQGRGCENPLPAAGEGRERGLCRVDARP